MQFSGKLGNQRKKEKFKETKWAHREVSCQSALFNGRSLVARANSTRSAVADERRIDPLSGGARLAALVICVQVGAARRLLLCLRSERRRTIGAARVPRIDTAAETRRGAQSLAGQRRRRTCIVGRSDFKSRPANNS